MPTLALSRRRALLVVACALGLVLAATRFISAPESKPTATTLTPVLAAPAPEPVRQNVVVDVQGAVRRPGLYRLRSGARIADAIARAGGVTRKADSSLVNLAAPLADGQQVVVPRAGMVASASAAAVSPASPTARVNLNSATVEQLDTLAGVGPVTAQKIVEYRQVHGPFTSVDQLDAIAGIGPTRIDNLRGQVSP